MLAAASDPPSVHAPGHFSLPPQGPGRAASRPTGDPGHQGREPEPHQQAEPPPFQGPARRLSGSSGALTPQLPGPGSGARHQQQLPPRQEFQDLRVSGATAEAREASWAAGSLEGSLRQQGARYRSRPPEGGPAGCATRAQPGRQPGTAPKQQHQSTALPVQQQTAQGTQQPAPASSQQQRHRQQQQQGALAAGTAPGQPRAPSRGASTDELSSQTSLELTQLLPRLGESLRAASTGGERWPHAPRAGVQQQLQHACPPTELSPASQGPEAGIEVALPPPAQDVAASTQHHDPAVGHCPRSPSFAGETASGVTSACPAVLLVGGLGAPLGMALHQMP